jgi:FkbM family methyltransferase
MIYQENQLVECMSYINESIPISWFILGGPSDGNEAQGIVKLLPKINILGCEPYKPMYQWQLDHDWPISNGQLLGIALGNKECKMALNIDEDKPRCSSFMQERTSNLKEIVSVDTIDNLSLKYGPFTNIFLWLDIEGHEYEALEGAEELFACNEINIINLEILERRAEHTEKIEKFMKWYGMIEIKRWNIHTNSHHDRLYIHNRFK